MNTKICPKCGIEKSLDYFSKNKTKKDGHSSWCKNCAREKDRNYNSTISGLERRKIWRQNNPEKIRESQKHCRQTLEYKQKRREKENLKRAKKVGFSTLEEYQQYLIEKKENTQKKKEAEKESEKIRKKEKKEQQNILSKKNRIKKEIEAINNIKYNIDEKECWNIVSGTVKHKCGYHKVNYKWVHREIYKIKKGDILHGNIIRHTCDNPDCVNPNHLIQGTKKDNTQDMLSKNRQVKKGQVIRLTEEQIKEIYLSNKSSYELADIYPITSTQIRRIKNGTRCKDITCNL